MTDVIAWIKRKFWEAWDGHPRTVIDVYGYPGEKIKKGTRFEPNIGRHGPDEETEGVSLIVAESVIVPEDRWAKVKVKAVEE